MENDVELLGDIQNLDLIQEKETIYQRIVNARKNGEEYDFRSDPDWVEPTFASLYESSRLHTVHLDSIAQLKESTNTRLMLEDMTRIAAGSKKPIFLWGPPGARKTRTIEAFSRDLDENGVPFQVIVAQPSTDDPTVIHGIRYTTLDDKGRTVMNRSMPDIIAQVKDYNDDYGGLTILMIDEITTCTVSQQNAMLGYLTHGTFAGVDISKLATCIVAGNPENTVSTALPLTEAVMNRGCHIPWYGDVELFLRDWTSGWRGAVEPPNETTQEIVGLWLKQGGDLAFRDSAWDIESLVPYELMTHSERATTDLSEIITVVNDVYESASILIRNHIIIEFTKAYCGPEWANKMSAALSLVGTQIEPRNVKSKVTRAINKYGYYDFYEHVKDSMHTIQVRSRNSMIEQECPSDMFRSVANSIADDIKNEAEKHNYNRVISMVPAFWAFVSSRSNASDLELVSASILIVYRYVGIAVKGGYMSKEDAIPPYVSIDVKKLIKRKIAEASQ